MNKKYFQENLNLYQHENNSQSPIQKQFYRARFNLIIILISLFILIQFTVLIYYFSKHFLNENYSKL